NDLATTHPEVMEMWAAENTVDPTAVLASSTRITALWDGPCGHRWEAALASVSKGSRCPYCAGQKVLAGFNDLASQRPDVAALWHPGNDLAADAVTVRSGRKVRWLCESGHEWSAAVAAVSGGSGCPTCGGKRADAGKTDLATKRPDLAAQVVGTDPSTLTVYAHTEVLWRAPDCGHEWTAEVRSRSQSDTADCAVCRGRVVVAGVNDLATRFPGIAAEVVEVEPSTLHSGSAASVEWRCPDGHLWRETVARRTRDGASCPVCSGREVRAGVNDLAT